MLNINEVVVQEPKDHNNRLIALGMLNEHNKGKRKIFFIFHVLFGTFTAINTHKHRHTQVYKL